LPGRHDEQSKRVKMIVRGASAARTAWGRLHAIAGPSMMQVRPSPADDDRNGAFLFDLRGAADE